MARGNNQKLKLLYLVKIFKEETDDNHDLTLQDIAALLGGWGIPADRKTLYQDFEELRRFGMDIIAEKRGRNTYYHLGQREFELPELKLLVDAVQASRFLTDRKSRQLIHKLEGLVSRHQAQQLQRQVLISGRVKSMNESIYYSVDALHDAINSDCSIRFHYIQWTLNKETVPRRGGAWYTISPWRLVWGDQNYYLIGYDAAEDRIKHFRVDKMRNISLTGEPRRGKERFEELDLARYTDSLFGMFGGEVTPVTLRAENAMVGVIIDRFGKDVPLTPVDEDHFEVSVNVVVSPQFFGWIFGLGGGVQVTGPHPVVQRIRREVERLNAQYGE